MVGFSLLGVLALANLSGTAHAASTSPGKTAVYASTAAAVISDPPTTVVTATIEKGKKKRVLEIDLSVVLTGANTLGTLTVAPLVNGLAIAEPVNGGTTAPARNLCLNTQFEPSSCLLSLQYWLDLDAAEAAHPGVFIKQPLVIDGQVGWDITSSPVSGVVSLRARLQKK
jgi:hypothetical protein